MAANPVEHEVLVLDHQIYEIRSQRVILDSDLARAYGVTTKRFNEAFKRNRKRFPEDFVFRLSKDEFEDLRSQFATSKTTGRGGRRSMPWAFTEHGALMAASMLNSDKAVEMGVYVIRAFVRLRELALTNREILKRLAEIDNSLILHDKALRDLYQKLLPLLKPEEPKPRKRIGFRPVGADE